MLLVVRDCQVYTDDSKINKRDVREALRSLIEYLVEIQGRV